MRNIGRLGQAGETIVEVLMVVVVLGSALTTAFVLTNKASNNNQASQDRTEASSYGQDQLERLKSLLAVNDASLVGKTNFCIRSSDNTATTVVDTTAGGCTETDRNLFGGYISYDSATTTYTEHVNWDRAGSGRDTLQMVYRASYLSSGSGSALGSIPAGGAAVTNCPSSLIPDGGMLACYYNDTSFGNFVFQQQKKPVGLASFSPTATNIIDDNFGAGSPGVGVNNDNFSIRYQGKFDFAAGTYTFTAGSDDGMRLIIDGVTIIDQYGPHSFPNPKYQAIKDMTAGKHSVQVDYYENGTDAQVRLYWSKTTLVEAESLTPNGGLNVSDDPGASNGKTMTFGGPGTASGPFYSSTGIRSFTVRAKGDQNNGPPIMTVAIDGTNYMTQPVSNTDFGLFTALTLPIGAGNHTVSITFNNDLCGPPCSNGNPDRNLYVDYISFSPNAP